MLFDLSRVVGASVGGGGVPVVSVCVVPVSEVSIIVSLPVVSVSAAVAGGRFGLGWRRVAAAVPEEDIIGCCGTSITRGCGHWVGDGGTALPGPAAAGSVPAIVPCCGCASASVVVGRVKLVVVSALVPVSGAFATGGDGTSGPPIVEETPVAVPSCTTSYC